MHFKSATDTLARSLWDAFGKDVSPATKADIANAFIALARTNDALLALHDAAQSNRASDWFKARSALEESIKSVGSGVESLSPEKPGVDNEA